jgi:hypothetical protein
MTELLKKAFAEIEKLPDDAQDALANWIFEELESERLWDKKFSESQDILAQLADEALAEYRAGKTEQLDPDTL